MLLPTEKVPLHIFEPRYKELIGECLADDADFGLVLADEHGRRDVGTRAHVVQVLQVFDDGRLNIVVEGRERFRVIDEIEGRSYPAGEIEPLEDEGDPPGTEDVERAVALFADLVETAEAEVDQPNPESEQLSFELAARVDFGSDLKQELLELRSERARLHRLVELLELALKGLKAEREVRERAATNGRLSPRLLDGSGE